MCGRLNVTDDPAVRALCDAMDVHLGSEPQIFHRYLGAASQISVIRQQGERRLLQNAIWWLLQDQTPAGFKPSRYTSINTRYDSLSNPRKAGFEPYRKSRILIPVSGFGESEYQSGKLLHCHDIIASRGAMLLGGLAMDWQHSETGETLTSCSIITLPPHDKLKHIHSKSTPMMFPIKKGWVRAWLDPNNQDVRAFERLLTPVIHQDLLVQQIAKPSHYEDIIGDSMTITADD